VNRDDDLFKSFQNILNRTASVNYRIYILGTMMYMQVGCWKQSRAFEVETAIAQRGNNSECFDKIPELI
jgi:hypothetical protein